jgi:hypothetical protein
VWLSLGQNLGAPLTLLSSGLLGGEKGAGLSINHQAEAAQSNLIAESN